MLVESILHCIVPCTVTFHILSSERMTLEKKISHVDKRRKIEHDKGMGHVLGEHPGSGDHSYNSIVSPVKKNVRECPDTEDLITGDFVMLLECKTCGVLEDQLKLLTYCQLCGAPFHWSCSSNDKGTPIDEWACQKCCQNSSANDVTKSLSAEDLLISDTKLQQPCIICGLLEDPLKLMICGLCEAPFHYECSSIDTDTPIDEWWCQQCYKNKSTDVLKESSCGEAPLNAACSVTFQDSSSKTEETRPEKKIKISNADKQWEMGHVKGMSNMKDGHVGSEDHSYQPTLSPVKENAHKCPDMKSSVPVNFILLDECKTCGLLEDHLKLLTCDLCAMQFHRSCSLIDMDSPIEKWVCQHCYKIKSTNDVKESSSLETHPNSDTDIQIPCTKCGILEDCLKMQVCNLCAAPFHLSCSSLHKDTQIDEWCCEQCYQDKSISNVEGSSVEATADTCTKMQLPCRSCGVLDDNLKMLICDLCEAAFHLPCCSPKIVKIPHGNWYCKQCFPHRPKSKTRYPRAAASVAAMLRDKRTYTSDVPISSCSQADVPDWTGPTQSCDDYFDEPVELDICEFLNPKLQQLRNKNYRYRDRDNWIQCHAMVDSQPGNPVVCGKWRRAPRYIKQTDDWECYCSVLWDPKYADCAVPQELDTAEVLEHLARQSKGG